MKYFATLLLMLLTITACGREPERLDLRTRGKPDITRLNNAILALQGLQSQINNVILSDYATCSSVPTDGGSTDNDLIRKICQIAQASEVEARNKLKGELQSYMTTLDRELQAVQQRLQTLESQSGTVTQIATDLYGTGTSCANATAGSLCSKVATLESSVSTLESQMTSAQSAISTLQSQVASINSNLNTAVAGMMYEISIGNELVSAGPLFESVLRKGDRTRITAYMETFGAPITPTSLQRNGDMRLQITASTAHNLQAGDTVLLTGFTACGNWTANQINTRFRITNIPSATQFQVTFSTSPGGGGGCTVGSGTYASLDSRGLGNAWVVADGEQLLSTSLTYKNYNFLVTGASTTFTASPSGAALPSGFSGLTPGAGFICYSKSDRLATLATIKLGSNDILCK